jgi:dihydrofolate reductase
VARELIRAGEVDELHLTLNPVVLGSGQSLLGNLNQRIDLKLIESNVFDCGVVALYYERR